MRQFVDTETLTSGTADVEVKIGVGIKVADGVCVADGGSGEGVRVGDSSPVTGTPGSEVRVCATAIVCAMTVLIESGSGVIAPGTQAWRAISNTELSKGFKIAFSMFPLYLGH
jgi:hypothetical protein